MSADELPIITRMGSASTRNPGSFSSHQARASGFPLDHPVDAFGAAIAHHAEPRHTGIRAEAVDLLVDGHKRKQVVNPLFHRQRRIVERVTGLLRKRRNKAKDQKTDEGGKVLLYHGGHRLSIPNKAPGAAVPRAVRWWFQNVERLSRAPSRAKTDTFKADIDILKVSILASGTSLRRSQIFTAAEPPPQFHLRSTPGFRSELVSWPHHPSGGV